MENTNTKALNIINGVLYKISTNVAGVMIENNKDIVALKTRATNADSLSTMLTVMMGLISVSKIFFIWFSLFLKSLLLFLPCFDKLCGIQ